MATIGTQKAGRLVFYQDVAQVEAAVLEHVKEIVPRAWLLLGCIAVDSLKSIAVSLNRAPSARDNVVAPAATASAQPEVF